MIPAYFIEQLMHSSAYSSQHGGWTEHSQCLAGPSYINSLGHLVYGNLHVHCRTGKRYLGFDKKDIKLTQPSLAGQEYVPGNPCLDTLSLLLSFCH
jgi:hypothetical protein